MNNIPMRRIASFALLFGILLATALAVINRYDILDWFALRNYQPPAHIVALADQTTMSDPTRRVFYATRPLLDDKVSFKQHCEVEEQSIVLGCYVTTRGIFLLDVTDERLQGVEQVTAAHEVLHAHYDRLGGSERKRIDGLTASYFASIQDERIIKTVEQYRAKDPKIVPNELHSILGTEVRDLSPELEQYYSRYFKDRKQIVAFSEQYEQTFIGLKNEVSNYDADLAKIKSQIEANETRINSLGSNLESQRAQLDRMLANNQTEEYNAAVPGFNNIVGQYNLLVGQTRQLIAEYNAIVEKRNAAASTEQELVQAIDTNSLPAEQKQ